MHLPAVVGSSLLVRKESCALLALSRATFDKANIGSLGNDEHILWFVSRLGRVKLKLQSVFSMFETSALQGLEDLVTTLDTGDRDEESTRKTLIFSRKLHYLLSNLTTDTARLVVRQNADSNGFETWRRLFRKFALPDATRHVSLLTLIVFQVLNHVQELKVKQLCQVRATHWNQTSR